MTRKDADELVSALDEWLILRVDRSRFLPHTREYNRASLLSDAARERLLDRLSGEEGTQPRPGNER